MDQGMSTIFMLLLMLAIFYFMLIRPENKRKKQAEEMRSSLKKGDVITTIGGIVGKIVTVNQDTIIIETSEDRVRMEITKWAVSTNGVQTGEAQAKNKKKGEKAEEQTADALPEEPVDEIPAPEETEKQD
jgi:preprotein translocase subunit YajC